MQIYAVYLFEAIQNKQQFYAELKNLVKFLEKDLNVLKVKRILYNNTNG